MSDAGMIIHELQPVGKNTHDSDLSIVGTSAIRNSFIEQQSYYSVDIFGSEAVQFNRCKLNTQWNYLIEGRLWFEEWTSAGFLKWVNSLTKWIRSKYEYDSSKSCHIGPDAARLAGEGKLKLGPPADLPPKKAEIIW